MDGVHTEKGRAIFGQARHDKRRVGRADNLLYGILACFMVWGLWLSRHQWRRFALLYVTIIAFWAISAFSLHVIRYRLPIETIGMIFASAAVIAIFRRHKTSWVPWVIVGTVIAANIIIMILGAPLLQHLRETIHDIG